MEPNNPPFLTDEEKLRLHLQRSHTERFYMLMRLIKLTKKLEKAKIVKAENWDGHSG